MTSVFHAIAALLYDHDAVTVAGLGTFLCQRRGAKVNVITNQFEKPTATLGFDTLQRDDDGLVAQYVANHEGITIEEADALVKAFAEETLEKLVQGETVTIPSPLYYNYSLQGYYYRECRITLDDQHRCRHLLTTADYPVDSTYRKLPLPTEQYHLYELQAE